MSMAKKCDICGSLYENYGRNNEGNAITPNSIMLACKPYTNNDVYNNMKMYDCCPSCMKHIHTLINSIKVPAMMAEKKECAE